MTDSGAMPTKEEKRQRNKARRPATLMRVGIEQWGGWGVWTPATTPGRNTSTLRKTQVNYFWKTHIKNHVGTCYLD